MRMQNIKRRRARRFRSSGAACGFLRARCGPLRRCYGARLPEGLLRSQLAHTESLLSASEHAVEAHIETFGAVSRRSLKRLWVRYAVVMLMGLRALTCPGGRSVRGGRRKRRK